MTTIIRRHGEFFLSSRKRNITINAKRYAKRDTEDLLDYLHRLLKQKVGIETAAALTGLPVESVRHVAGTNWINIRG